MKLSKNGFNFLIKFIYFVNFVKNEITVKSGTNFKITRDRLIKSILLALLSLCAARFQSPFLNSCTAVNFVSVTFAVTLSCCSDFDANIFEME